jgi:hypothetical protein
MKEIIQTFISSSGSGTVINYGSGSTTLRPGPVVYLCLDCFRRGREGRAHRSCHAYSVLRRDFCLLEAGWTAGQAVRYRKSPMFDHLTKLRPLLHIFFLEMQLTDNKDRKTNIFMSFHYLILSNFYLCFSVEIRKIF